MDKYIFITGDGHPLPIADRLQDEDKLVVVGLIEDPPSKETPESEEKRQQLYDGVLDVQPAEIVMRWAEKLPDKDRWFVMLDYGDLWPWSQRMLDAGFRRGVFPTESSYELEHDREYGKEFARQHYPEVEVAEAPEFKQVEDAVDFLNQNKDKVYVLKSEGSEAETVVPETEDPDLARRQIVGALTSEQQEYEKGKFTLEEKIRQPVEISPVMIFSDGEPIFSLVELENKGLGSGNVGRLTGGCQNLTLETPLECRLNEIAFPHVIHEMARSQPGIGIYDAGLLHDGRRFFFTEFCGMRWGWDGIFSELAMCQSNGNRSKFVSRHFDLLAEGKNPLRNRFGAAVRLFQTQPDSKLPNLYQDGYSMDWTEEACPHLFFYCLRREKGEEGEEFFSVGYRKDLGVAVGAGNFMEVAVDQAYSAVDGFAMTGVYYRPKFDFLSRAYPTSIANRYRWIINSGLID